jgi:hypothetical protein
VLDLQDEIAHTIAGAIEPEILKFERERIAERPPRSEDAYEIRTALRSSSRKPGGRGHIKSLGSTPCTAD